MNRAIHEGSTRLRRIHLDDDRHERDGSNISIFIFLSLSIVVVNLLIESSVCLIEISNLWPNRLNLSEISSHLGSQAAARRQYSSREESSELSFTLTSSPHSLQVLETLLILLLP